MKRFAPLTAPFVIALAACTAPSTSSLGSSGLESASGDPPTETTETPSSSSSSSSAQTPRSRDARVSFRLVDAPADAVTEVVVTFDRLEAKTSGGWKMLAEGRHTIDLLTLQGGKSLDLGQATLAPGRVLGLRMHLVGDGEQYVTLKDGSRHALKVPSGEQSGIKLIGAFDVPECGTGVVTLDFDGKRSLMTHPRGKDGTDWIMRPVVRIKAVAMAGTCPEANEADGGAAAGASPSDPCASVTCSETEICDNGTCRIAEDETD